MARKMRVRLLAEILIAAFDLQKLAWFSAIECREIFQDGKGISVLQAKQANSFCVCA
jgi:hypothetical protein